MTLPPQRASLQGRGKATLRSIGRDAVFSELSYAYPLKLLTPRLHHSETASGVAILYVLSYGGGLVSDDQVHLSVDVGPDSSLVILTQGSTKIFRARGQLDRVRASNPSIFATIPADKEERPAQMHVNTTSQRINVRVTGAGCLFLLPDPVTCFADSSYTQVQTFHVGSGEGSIAVLDWFTSGRMSRGEEWAFARYKSINEIWLGDRRVVRDVMLLEDDTRISGGDGVVQTPAQVTATILAPRPLKDRLAPYSCYATLFLFGPAVSETLSKLRRQYDTIIQFQRTDPPPLIWSLSSIESGGVVRIAAKETESIKLWLKEGLTDLIAHVGAEAYSKIFV
ncbi:hypothetical protein FRC02_008072 [Tulasnella sp. 418]|nr:hypothetical protein FRC02_008072 [Tulasnella sp. 418]